MGVLEGMKASIEEKLGQKHAEARQRAARDIELRNALLDDGLEIAGTQVSIDAAQRGAVAEVSVGGRVIASVQVDRGTYIVARSDGAVSRAPTQDGALKHVGEIIFEELNRR